jgi:hypothetical protein
MQWVARESLERLAFPPADAELIEMLRSSGGEQAGEKQRPDGKW